MSYSFFGTCFNDHPQLFACLKTILNQTISPEEIILVDSGEVNIKREILDLINNNLINGCVNITGGGLADNIKRVIPDNLEANINLNIIKTLKIFKWLKQKGISDEEMLKTFNCGVGFCLIVSPKKLKKVQKYFSKKFKPYVIGKIIKGQKKVSLNGSINWL